MNPGERVRLELEQKRREREQEEKELERRHRERQQEVRDQEERARLQRLGPAPPATLGPLGFDPRFLPQQVVNLPDVGPRGPGGGPPEEIVRSEADRLRDPQARLAALEARVAFLEDVLKRHFGDALGHGSPGRI